MASEATAPRLHPARRWPWRLLAGLALVLAAVVVLLITPSRMMEWAQAVFAWLDEAPPALYFGTMAIACLFPVPASAFYVAAGPLFGVGPALGWSAVALLLNLLISHAVTSGYLRPRLGGVLERRGYRIPVLGQRKDELSLILLVRITPGVPWFAQNLMLGLSGVGLMRYLVLSLPIQMVFAFGFITLGKSAFDGQLGLLVTAVGLIGGASLAARLVYGRLSVRLDRGGAKSPEA